MLPNLICYLRFCTRNERNFSFVELSVTEKSLRRSPTSKYVPFFKVPANTSVSEYPQFIESLSTALINTLLLSKESQRS